MPSKLLLSLLLTIVAGSQARAAFNDSVFITVSPSFPADIALEMSIDNSNEAPGYCTLHVDATYVVQGSEAVKRHLLLTPNIFIPAKDRLDDIEFGAKEFQDLGMPGAHYLEAEVVGKDCQPLPDLSYQDTSINFVEWLSVKNRIVTFGSFKGAKLIEACKGQLDDASVLELMKLINDTSSQTFDKTYGTLGTSVPRVTTLKWNTATQSKLSMTVYQIGVPENIKALLKAFRQYKDKASTCSSQPE